LQHSQRLEAIGKLTGGVAHDFNNVLQIIAGNLYLLQDAVPLDAKARARMQAAEAAVERGAKLSSQLLAFARRQALQPVVTNLRQIIRNMDDLLRRALGEFIQVETVVSGGLWNTNVDTGQLENVILNLAINARDAMKNGGKLTIELGNAMLDDHYVMSELDIVAGQYVLLAISDTGEGMTPDVLSRAFDPFFTTKPEGEGTGLGLSMAYGFVKQSGGHIRIYSEVGHGTTVKIYLPRSLKPEANVSALPSTPISGGTETILVVEDDLAVQASVADMLTALGYRVLQATDGEKALAVIQSGISIDLIFTDVVMPGSIRSVELARQAKIILPEVEILFTSGYTRNAIVHGGRLDEGVALLSKPYRREDLARKMRQLLGNKKPTATAQTCESSAQPLASRALKILVVEDNEDFRELVCEMLLMLGHAALSVASGEQALEAIKQNNIELMISDLSLPGMSGVELAKKVHATWPNIKIVLSSGYDLSTGLSLDFELAVLSKPYSLAQLSQALGQLTSNSG
jgi:CheY-like chemotaxis protein